MTDKIKNYPIQFTEQDLKDIEQISGKRKIKSFIYIAIAEKMAREKKKHGN